MAEMSPEEKLDLIKLQLHEVLDEDIIKKIILEEKRPLEIYWGTAPTGKPHCAYFVPMVKVAHFLRAGCKVKILIADEHAALDDLKSPREQFEFKAQYYKLLIQALLRAVGVSLDSLEFALGSDHQLSGGYPRDLLKLFRQVTFHDGMRAGSEVVKQTDASPFISSVVYPLMQALDEEYLKVDAQFGGKDQRKIFVLAKEILPKIGYKERAHLMNPMVPGLTGGKMSASVADSKIDVLDTADDVRRKIKKAPCVPREVEENGLIAFVEYVLIPIADLKGKGGFTIERKDDTPLVYKNAEQLKADYTADILTPQLLKAAVSTGLIEILAPIQEEYQASKEWQEIERKAYPPPEKAVKVDKKAAKAEKAERRKADKEKFAVATQGDGTAVAADHLADGVKKLAV